MGKSEDEFWNCPKNDVRFSEAQVTKWCFQSYIDYHKCSRLLGKEYKPCNFFKNVFTSICPIAWVDKWDEQQAEGTFPVDFPEQQ